MTKRAKRGIQMSLKFLAAACVAAGLILAGASQSAQAEKPEDQTSIGAQTQRDVADLLRLLETGIRQNDAAIKKLEGRLPKVRKQVEELTEIVQSIQPPESNKPPRADEVEREVKYRPPMERLVDKKCIDFICEEGRVSFIDFQAVNECARGLTGQGRINVDHELPNSDFKIVGYVEKKGKRIEDAKLTVVRLSGRQGEPWEEIQRGNSRFQAVISSRRKPKDYYVDFSVWPDSHEIFRQVRSMAWRAGFDVQWTPMKSGERMELSPGTGIGIVQ